jgi:hypothetical protein
VYRGKLRPEWGGRQVAVKVQRPGALESVALDVYLMRRAAALFSSIPGMSDKWASALDDWALRFFLVGGGRVSGEGVGSAQACACFAEQLASV